MKRKFNDFKKLNNKKDDINININDLYESFKDIYYYDFINKIRLKHDINLPYHICLFLDYCSFVKCILDIKLRSDKNER